MRNSFGPQRRLLFATLPMVAFWANGAVADDYLSAEAYLAYLDALAAQTEQAPMGNASTVGVASGFGLPSGVGFAVAALSDTRERGQGDGADGSMALGLGFGDSINAVGLEVILNITSVLPSDFADSGTVNVKFSRNIDTDSAISVSVANAIKWGDAKNNDVGTTFAYSRRFALQGRSAMISAGYSSNIGTLDDEPGGFIGFGLALTDKTSAGLSWYGDEWVAGVNTTVTVLGEDIQAGISYSDITQKNTEGRLNITFAVMRADLY